jgi:hypothetical protein
MAVGESATKKVIVQSQQPFVVLQVDCGQDTGLSAPMEGLNVPKKLHVIPVTMAPAKSGQLQQQIVVTTSVGNSNFMVTSAAK